MNFEWKMAKGEELSFEDKVHNLACFEIVLNILRIKATSKEDDVGDEVRALCGFALECMFGKKDLEDEDLLERIMTLKEDSVADFRTNMLKQMGIPKEMVSANEIGEA